jgi:hypothetical protein
MIRTDAKVGEQQLLAARVRASTIRFNGYKYGVDVLQRLGIVGSQNPSLLADVILVSLIDDTYSPWTY